MISWDKHMEELRSTVLKEKTLKDELDELRWKTGLSIAGEDEQRAALELLIRKKQQEFGRHVDEMLWFPKQHVRHFHLLEEFWKTAGKDSSVFVMTKYPDASAPSDLKLQAVIDCVKDAVTACGFTPRLASDYQYHPQMWDNIELYLMGCMWGIAIVENKHTHETNPNVSMEWGWMRGMGRQVRYLIEKDFAHPRADFVGFISSKFDFDNPQATIPGAVKHWLKP